MFTSPVFSANMRRVWEIFDHRMQFMGGVYPDAVGIALTLGDVSAAWLRWSKSAETPLAHH